MRKYLVFIVCIAVAGCGSSALKKDAKSPQVQKQVQADQREAEKIVQGCLNKGSDKAIIHCIAPPGHKVAFERCALNAASSDFFHHSRLAEDLATCVKKYR